jgi:hypothetical protein
LFATVAPEKLASRELDASVGASGPHDFAVRKHTLSSVAWFASTASRPNVRDDGQRPSAGQDGASFKSDLGELRSKIFLQKGLDAGSTNDSDLPAEAGQELGIFES